MKFFQFLLLAVLTLGFQSFATAQADGQMKDKMAAHDTMESADHMMKDGKEKTRTIKLTQTEGEYVQGPLELKAGYYVFQVKNKSVDKDLGFYLQAADGSQVEGSGLQELVGAGETSSSSRVYLAPGTYQYSCPLNPTPHYTVTVK